MTHTRGQVLLSLFAGGLAALAFEYGFLVRDLTTKPIAHLIFWLCPLALLLALWMGSQAFVAGKAPSTKKIVISVAIAVAFILVFWMLCSLFLLVFLEMPIRWHPAPVVH